MSDCVQTVGSAAGTTPPTGTAAPLLECLGATRRFGSFTAVDGADLAVATGEIVGLLGANGAGKTTLIRMALGLLRPSGGRVRLFEAPPSRESRRRLGYVPQGLGLWDDLTVDENLAFSVRAFQSATGRRRRDTRASAAVIAPATAGDDEVFDDELIAARDELVRDLPLGLRRRLAFATALAHRPELLVLDEPTSGVDPLARTQLWGTVRAAVEAGAGALVTTHYMDEAEQCDRLVVMAQGRVVAAGTVADIVGDLKAVEVTAGRWEEAFAVLDAAGLPLALAGRTLRVPGGDAARVRSLLDARRVAASLRIVQATLEETFVVLAGSTGSDVSREQGIQTKTPRKEST